MNTFLLYEAPPPPAFPVALPEAVPPGPPFGRVRAPPRSPASLLVCDPPTPCPRRPRLRSPLPVAYLDAGTCSMPIHDQPTTRAPANASRVGSLESAPGLLPARAGSPLAGQDSYMLDDKQRVMKASHPPIPFDPQGLVALKFLYTLVAMQGVRPFRPYRLSYFQQMQRPHASPVLGR